MTKVSSSQGTIKAVALYEVVKGIGGLSAAFALWRWHTHLLDWLTVVETLWLERFGTLFSAQVDTLTKLAQRASDHWLWFLWLIIGYTSIRFIEAYGLWRDKTWAYWFSVLGYGVFIPLEAYYLVVHPFDWIKFVVLLMNIGVVTIVYQQMRRKGMI